MMEKKEAMIYLGKEKKQGNKVTKICHQPKQGQRQHMNHRKAKMPEREDHNWS